MKHEIGEAVITVGGVPVGRVTSGTYSFVADDPKPLRGLDGETFPDGALFKATWEAKAAPGAIGFLARKMHRAGRNRRKALRRKRGGR